MVGLGGVYVYMFVLVLFVLLYVMVWFNLVLFCVFYISSMLVCAIVLIAFSCCLQLYTLYT